MNVDFTIWIWREVELDIENWGLMLQVRSALRIDSVVQASRVDFENWACILRI
jgi:hypothetical protein